MRQTALADLNFTYVVYGLFLRCNLQLPELTPASAASAVVLSEPWADCAVAVHLKMSPNGSEVVASGSEECTYDSPYKDQEGNSVLKIWRALDGTYLRLAYFDGAQFWLDQHASQVWATWPDSLTTEDAVAYLLGPVLGLVLRLRGVTCLHASAVEFGEHAVAFVGPPGAGKSTTAAALASRGHAVLSDDVVTLSENDGAFLVYPAYPYLCLWPESVESLYGSAETFPRFSQNYQKCRLSLEKYELLFERRTLPLIAVYVLSERHGDPAPIIENMSPQTAFLALIANTFATNVLDGPMRANEFKLLGRLAPRVVVRRLHAHEDVSRLADLCERICKDVQEIKLNKPAFS